jgi:hypothetical protein
MKKLSLNFKKIALSLLVVGLAMGVQSFTNSQSKVATGDYYVQTGADEYTLVQEEDFISSCENTSNRPCYFQQTTNTPYAATLTYDEVIAIPATPADVEGLYTGPLN